MTTAMTMFRSRVASVAMVNTNAAIWCIMNMHAYILQVCWNCCVKPWDLSIAVCTRVQSWHIWPLRHYATGRIHLVGGASSGHNKVQMATRSADLSVALGNSSEWAPFLVRQVIVSVACNSVFTNIHWYTRAISFLQIIREVQPWLCEGVIQKPANDGSKPPTSCGTCEFSIGCAAQLLRSHWCHSFFVFFCSLGHLDSLDW